MHNYKSIHRIIYFQVRFLSLQWPVSPGALRTPPLPRTVRRGNPLGPVVVLNNNCTKSGRQENEDYKLSMLACSQEAIKGTLHFNNASGSGDVTRRLRPVRSSLEPTAMG